MRELSPGPISKEEQTGRVWNCRANDPNCSRASRCVACRNKRNAGSGKRFQRNSRKKVEKLTGTIAAKFLGQLGNEESWAGLPWRVECKYGKQVEPAVTQYEKMRKQSDASHALGDPRPFVGIVGVPRGRTILLVDITDTPDMLAPLEGDAA